MIIKSDSRGVPRNTSAPKRARSWREVMLVIISTKQQDKPKNIGQRLFLRLQLISQSALVAKKPVSPPGPVEAVHFPGGPGVRIDSHVYSGYTISPYYDSMIGKLIAHGPSRQSALARMQTALTEIVVEGIRTNIPLHQEIFQHAAFQAGGTDIHYLEKRLGLT